METGAISHSEIEVAVKDTTGSALSGVTGTLSGAIGERIEISNARGQMTFTDLPPATYELAFALEGFRTIQRIVTIHEVGEVDPIAVTLEVAL